MLQVPYPIVLQLYLQIFCRSFPKQASGENVPEKKRIMKAEFSQTLFRKIIQYLSGSLGSYPAVRDVTEVGVLGGVAVLRTALRASFTDDTFPLEITKTLQKSGVDFLRIFDTSGFFNFLRYPG